MSDQLSLNEWIMKWIIKANVMSAEIKWMIAGCWLGWFGINCSSICLIYRQLSQINWIETSQSNKPTSNNHSLINVTVMIELAAQFLNFDLWFVEFSRQNGIQPNQIRNGG